MTQQSFEDYLSVNSKVIEEIRQSAWDLHNSVGQTYGDRLPYGHHLDMVVSELQRYAHLVVTNEEDVLPLFFSGYYHDSIEDARLTYNDLLRTARQWMNDEQARMATEIVYALTNDKGRTREERAGEHYYEGIRQTPYAPLVKLCDRLANVSHSCASNDATNQRMRKVYSQEMPHFLKGIEAQSDDLRFTLPKEAVERLNDDIKE